MILKLYYYPHFLVSKVDEKLKAAEARRAELQRAKAEEQERKYN